MIDLPSIRFPIKTEFSLLTEAIKNATKTNSKNFIIAITKQLN